MLFLKISIFFIAKKLRILNICTIFVLTKKIKLWHRRENIRLVAQAVVGAFGMQMDIR